MSDQRLLDYIQNQIQKGVAKNAIKAELINNGWSDEEVEQAMSEATASAPIIAVAQSPAPPTLPLLEEPEKTLKIGASQPQTPSNGKLKGALIIFSEAYLLYKKRLKTILGISFIPVVVQVILGILATKLLAPIFIPLTPGLFTGPLDINSVLRSLVPAGTAVVIGLLIVIVLQIWSFVALVCAIKDENEPLGILDSYRQAWSKIIRYYWTTILSGLIVLGTFALLVALGTLPFFFQISILSKIIMYGGFTLLLIPGVIIAIWVSFAGFIAISEEEKGIAAITKSREYTKGNWWEIMWRYIVGGALMTDIGFASLIGFFLIAFAFFYLAMLFQSDLISIIPLALANLVILIFIPPIFTVYLVSLYKNLKAQRNQATLVIKKGTKIGFTLLAIVGFIAVLIGLVALVFAIKTFNPQSFIPKPLTGMDTSTDISYLDRTNNARIGSAISQGRTVMVYNYSNDGNYNNFSCLSGEMATLCEDVKNKNSEIKIARSGNTACLYAKLLGSESSWYCADSQGNAGETNTNPATTCKDGLVSVTCPTISEILVD